MPAATESDDRDAWEALLRRRDHPKWASLSWLALRPLISAANDRINAFTPDLVDDLRQAWVARQKADGRWPALVADDGVIYHGVVDRREATAFVVLGDTGEQDASQYALIPELRRVAASLPGGAFALICSDVIYPSGDVNDYVHALYLPYGPRPDGAGVADDPLARLDILALPGNHDWYDGLAGFMFHFCGRQRLPRSVYGWRRGISWKEGVARLLWRRPSRPRPARLWAPMGPDPVAGRADDVDSTPGADRTRPRPLSDLRHERGLGHLQPGPYYAVELRDLLVVCIDTGIARDGGTRLDTDQSSWLLTVSRHPKPKLLFTGNPLRVDLVWKPCELTGPAAATHPDVHDVVRDPAHRYLATAGGDIHNYQSYAPEPDTGIRYLVSGGGGAFLSATHPLALIDGRSRHLPSPEAAAPVAPDVGGPVAPPAADRPDAGPVGRERPPADLAIDDLYPTDVESLKRFGRILLPRLWRLQRALLAMAAGLLVALLAVAGPGPRYGADDDPAFAPVAATAAAVAVVAVVRLALPATRARARRLLLVLLAFSFGGLAGTMLWWLDPGRAGRNAAGWAAVTGAGCLLAHLMRESSWWRTARATDPRLERWILPVAAGAWLGACAVALVEGARATLLLLVLLALAAVVGWWVRGVRGRRGQPWNAVAAVLAYSVQGALALAVVSEIILRPSTVGHPGATVLGLVLALAAALAGLGAAALIVGGSSLVISRTPPLRRIVAGWLLVTTDPDPAAGRPSWRELYGGLGFVAPWITATVAVGAPILGLAVTTEPGDLHPRWWQVTLASWAISAGTVASIILLDTLRRWARSHYLPANLAVVALACGLVWWQFHDTWALRGLGTALVAAALAVFTGIVVNLTFLRTWSLLLDRDVHEEGAREVFTDDEARQVLEWRRTASDDHEPKLAAVRRRGRIVFPSAYQPRGPIQAKVSEFFDDDNPPFAKNFLVVRTDGREVTITPRWVDGLSPIEPQQDAVIRLPLASR